MQSIQSANKLNPFHSRQPEAQAELKGSNCPWTASCEKQRTGPANDPITVSFILKNSNDAGDVEKFAKANGLSVSSVDARTKTVKLTGTPSQYNKALGVQVGNYKDGKGEIYRGYDGSLKLPASLAGKTTAVLGLDDHPIAKPHMVIGKRDQGPNGYLPTDVASLYNFPANTDGTGQTISIIEPRRRLQAGRSGQLLPEARHEDAEHRARWALTAPPTPRRAMRTAPTVRSTWTSR